ncbi:MAG: hypothetical protein ACK4QL_00185 [Pseudanabaenaceae cyanobacterium]
MANWFTRLFGGGDGQSDAYFLDQDSAKTLGNVDYMRKKSKIVRTFRVAGDTDAEVEVVKEISSLEERKVPETEQAKPKVVFEQNGANLQTDLTPRKEPASTDMDFFRKLAKEVKRQ